MECLVFPEMSPDAWWDRFYQPLGNARFPLSGSIDLTSRCNLNCVHCYINQPPGSRQALSKEMSTAQVKHVLDQAANAGCLFLLMTGGEPLLRADFSEIYLHARRKGLIITLFTNATLMTPAVIDLLLDAPPSQVEVTIYGATPATYEAVTRIPGSFRRFKQGLDLIAESGLKFYLKSVLLSLNEADLSQMIEFSQSYGADFRYDGALWPRLDGNLNNLKYRLSINEMLALDRRDHKRMAAWQETYQNSKRFVLRHEKIYNCGAGYRSFHIDSQGRLNVCMMARSAAPEILKLGFTTAWEQLGVEIQRKRTVKVECLTCTAAGVCIQCPGFSQLIHGDDETIVDYICQLAKQLEQNIINSDMAFEKLSK